MCDKILSSQKSVKTHIKWSHEKRKENKCNFCGKCLCSLKSLKNHINVFHGPNEFRCENCSNEIFKDKKSFYIHM